MRPAPSFTRTEDGVDVAWYGLGGEPDAPPLLLAHATGFHGYAFAPLARRLATSYRCVAFDERGHGDTLPRGDGSFEWDGFARDALAVVDAAGLDRPFGVGHSAGGAALLLAELARPGTFRALYCFEPIVPPVMDDGAERVARLPSTSNPLAMSARRRRPAFESKDVALANYASKPPMANFDPEALAAYVEHGLVDDGTGGVRLKCLPENEARTYEMSAQHGAFRRLAEVHCPVTVAWGSNTTTFGPDAFRAIAARLPAGRAEELEGHNHFAPFEDPERVARSVLDVFAAVAGA